MISLREKIKLEKSFKLSWEYIKIEVNVRILVFFQDQNITYGNNLKPKPFSMKHPNKIYTKMGIWIDPHGIQNNFLTCYIYTYFLTK